MQASIRAETVFRQAFTRSADAAGVPSPSGAYTSTVPSTREFAGTCASSARFTPMAWAPKTLSQVLSGTPAAATTVPPVMVTVPGERCAPFSRGRPEPMPGAAWLQAAPL